MITETSEDQNINQALESYLIRYCTNTIAPYFSVLIEGPWGCGKTWFINNVREKLLEIHGKRCLYVSLYGVSTISDISDQFFQQLHPRLASKGVQRSWSIIKSMVKVSLKVDIDGDKDDDTLNLSLPELGEMAGPDGAVLIFDDFERCRIAPAEVLGYINQFVEHEGYRVVILANEEKIESPDVKFSKIKEKVIGRTFHVRPQVRAAVDSFIMELVDDDAINILKTRKNLIREVEQRGKHNNLRLVRQAVLDFADMWSCMPVQEKRLKENSAFLDRLVLDIFSLSMEYRAGTVTANDIVKSKDGGFLLSRIRFGTDDPTPEASEAETRLSLHKITDSWDLALSPDIYSSFFSNGRISANEAAEGIKFSRYFATNEQPLWRRLWYSRDLEDNEFALLAEEAHNKFLNLEYTEWGELFHVTGILLKLAKDQLINDSPTDILSAAKGVIDRIGAQGLIDFGDQRRVPRGYFDRESAFGYRFNSIEMSEFQEFSNHYETAQKKARHNAFFNWASTWMDELERDASVWASRIDTKGGGDAFYTDQPIFSYIEATDMANAILASQSAKINQISRSVHARYEHVGAQRTWQLEELVFWQTCLAIVKDRMSSRGSKTLSTFHLRETLIPTVEEFLVRLEQLQKKLAAVQTAN
ncbi:hypothetical protein ASF04_20110 [Duganella sp. Leaf61]|nr:hypothetical protein ASF04_20110 [Duganella sp. Leaf61]